MLKNFSEYILSQDLCAKDDPILLAVSGGVDSVVMTDLFYRAGYEAVILHCNFGLRGEESDSDEAFVRSLAASYDYPVFVKQFETEEYADSMGISIQMAARELRYEWFDEMSHNQGITGIATAHNLNDSIETTFLNLLRGTGIKGLSGIPPKNKNYVRPLLFASREEIILYSSENNIRYREDSSNASTKYKRNKIRHDVIPPMEEMNPLFIQTMAENIERFKQSYSIYRKEIEAFKTQHFNIEQDHISIPLEVLKSLNPLSTWIYEIFSDYGFSMKQCRGIEDLLLSSSGKQFISKTYSLYRDRESLFLYRAANTGFERYYIDGIESAAHLPFSLDMEVIEKDEGFELLKVLNIACIDLDRMKFPLTIRKWQHGDYFMPLGMSQMKKVSDFFIDLKIPVPQKNRTWLLCSGKDIVWIMGLRLDNRYKITDNTSRILKLELQSSP